MGPGLRQDDERPSFWTAQKREVIQNPFSRALKFRMDSGLRQNDGCAIHRRRKRTMK
jgi:hypothetical protein